MMVNNKNLAILQAEGALRKYFSQCNHSHPGCSLLPHEQPAERQPEGGRPGPRT